MRLNTLAASLAAALAAGTAAPIQAANPLAAPEVLPDHKISSTGLPQAIDLQLETYRSTSTTEHKYLVPSDSAYRKAVANSRATDYDSFSLIRVEQSAGAKPLEGAVLADRMNLILLNSGVIDTTTTYARSLSQGSYGPSGGKGMALVQFAGPIRGEWYEALTKSGVAVITAIPENAYLVYGATETLQQLDGSLRRQVASGLQYTAPYGAEQRIDPAARAKAQATATALFSVQLFEDAGTNAQTLSLLTGARIVSDASISHYRNLVIELPSSALDALAAQPDVVSIQAYDLPRKLDERQDRIITGQLNAGQPVAGSHLQWLADHGFTQSQFDTSGLVVNLTDSGIDNGTSSPNHFALHQSGVWNGASRIVYNRLVGTPNSGSTLAGQDGHGTINSHIIGGYVGTAAPFNAAPHMDASGYHYGLGVAPFVKIGSSVIFDPGTFTNPNYATLENGAYNDGARISSNSWGSSSNAYGSDAQSYDLLVRDAQAGTPGNQEQVILFAAGNGGSGANTVGQPGTGKNVITVGASENVHAFGGADQCAVADVGADNANDIIGFSSRGPTSDGRKKPDIVAPGTHITGGVWQASSLDPAVSLNGGAAAAYDASGVCAGPGTPPAANFFPSGGQQWYTASSGTSHSTPATAGAAALTRQWFVNHSLPAPSPAMTKAVLTNAAHYMTGTGANDALPSNNQGMGLLDLDRTFDGVARLLRDQDAADLFTASGQKRVFTAKVVDATKPLRVSLAWTDKPGPTTGSAWLNNLDLEVSVNGSVYKGNVFTGGNSVTGGAADPRDNLESVFLPAGLPVDTPLAISIIATNVVADGVPGNASALDQDFALVAYNTQAANFPVINTAGFAQVSENGAPANGLPDPGEIVSYSLGLSNVGTQDTTNLTADLQPTGGVTQPDPSQNYGALVAGGSTVTKAFPFRVDPALACGAPLTLTWQLKDGASSMGSVVQNLTVGGTNTVTTPLQNFDAVTAPALPAGWVNANTGAGGAWLTSVTTPNSAPNAAFNDDPAAVSDKRLTSPAIAVPATGVSRLVFKQKFNTEAATSPTTGYDGTVLEISVDGGTTFTDILAAGGSFVSGGYNRTISASFSSPLAGRQAWSGNSSTYQDVVAVLPASTAGQNVLARWRSASDSTVAVTGGGYWLDDVQLANLAPACATSPAPSAVDLGIDVKNGRVNLQVGGTATYTVTISNLGPPTATGARVTVPVPAGLTGFSAWTCAGTGTASCAAPSGSGAIDTQVSLATAETVTFTITAQVGAVEQAVNFAASVQAPLGLTDGVTANNSDTDADPIVLFADGFDELPAGE